MTKGELVTIGVTAIFAFWWAVLVNADWQTGAGFTVGMVIALTLHYKLGEKL